MIGRIQLFCEYGGCFGFSVFRFGSFLPAAKIEGNGHAGVAEVIGESAVNEGAGNNHAPDAQRRDALCRGPAVVAVLNEATLQDADHGAENGLEGGSGGLAAARNVGRQRDHGARIFDIFKMLAREIGADDLRADVAGREVHFHAFPAAFPIRVGEKAVENLGVKVALAVEIAVKTAVSEAGAGHDLVDGDTFKAMAIEKFAGALDDVFLDGRPMGNGVRHRGLLVK
jgi:hypothetical protein